MIRFSVLLTIAVIFTACSRYAESRYRLAVTPKGSTHVFWKSIQAGAVKAEIDTGAILVTLNNIHNEIIQNKLFPPLSKYLEY